MPRHQKRHRLRPLSVVAVVLALSAVALLVQMGSAAAGPPESPQNEVPWTKVGPKGGCYWADIPFPGAIITASGCTMGPGSCRTTWSVTTGTGRSRGSQICTSDTTTAPGDPAGRTCKAAATLFPEVCPEPRGGQQPSGGSGDGGGRKGDGQTGGNLHAYGGASYGAHAPAASWGGRYGVRTYRPQPRYTPWWARR